LIHFSGDLTYDIGLNVDGSDYFVMIKGHMLSDVVAVLGSLNIIAAELDR
jgi:hypothetical protein